MSKIYIVMGKSATGKDTIFKRLKEQLKDNIKTVTGYTTRPIRAGESNGMEYFFVDKDKLNEFRVNQKLIEHRAYHTMHGVWDYFTVDDGQIKLEESSYIMIGTLESFEQIQSYFGKSIVCPIYIEVEDGLRLERALSREKNQTNPKYAEMCRRYLADEEDFKEENLMRLGIHKRYNNLEVDVCINEIIKDMETESIIKE